MAVADILRQFFMHLKALFVHAECILCRQSSDNALCPYCRENLSKEAMADKRRVLNVNTQPTNIYSFNQYDQYTQRLLFMFKYEKNHLAGSALCAYFAEVFKRQPSLKDVDVILPVPSHRFRYLTRGFNQAALLAYPLTRAANVSLSRHQIIKKKYTRSQAKSTWSQRQRQLDGTFSQKGSLEATHLLIIDDVITTGATIKAMIQLLQRNHQNQIKKISVATLCRV